MSIAGSSSLRRLKDAALIMHLHELAPIGGRATGRRDWRRHERFAEMGQDLPDRPWFRDERDQPDVAAARWALERKLLPHPRHELGPRNPRRVVRAGLLMRVTTASSVATFVPMPAVRGLPWLANVPDGQRRDGFSQLVVRREYSVVAMPVLPRRRDEIGEPVQKLKRRELDDAIGPRPRGLAAAAGPDPGGGFVPRQHVADAGNPAGWAADHGQSLQCKGRPGAVSEKMLKTLEIAGHIAVDECDPDTGVD